MTNSALSRRRWAAAAVLAASVAVSIAVPAASATSRSAVRTQTTTVSATAGTEVGVPWVPAAYTTRSRTETFVDTSRRTSANGTAKAKASRSLPTLIIEPVPSQGERFPLLVFAHGLGGEPAEYRSLLTGIAERGYVVAAPAFPLTKKRAPGGPNVFDEANQPGDVRFVIDKMLAASSASAPVLDRAQVAVAGHSLGAITTLDIVGNACCTDGRVKAAVSIAGSVNVFRQGKLFATPAVPLLFVHGDRDRTVPFALGYSSYQAARAPKHFVTVVGGGHVFDLANVPGSRAQVGPLVAEAMVRFLDAQLKGNGTAAASLRDEAGANPSLLRYESVLR